MRGKYYINITLQFFYFHLTIICLHVLCTNIIINVCIKAKLWEISSDAHQLQLIKLHHFKLEKFKSI